MLSDIVYHFLQTVGLLKYSQLAVGTCTLLQYFMNRADGLAAPKIIHYIINKVQQLVNQQARVNFCLFAKVNQLAIDAVPRSAPLVLIASDVTRRTIGLMRELGGIRRLLTHRLDLPYVRVLGHDSQAPCQVAPLDHQAPNASHTLRTELRPPAALLVGVDELEFAHRHSLAINDLVCVENSAAGH